MDFALPDQTLDIFSLQHFSSFSVHLPPNPVNSQPIRINYVSEIQINFLCRIVSTAVKCGQIGTFDGSKLRTLPQNAEVHNTLKNKSRIIFNV